MNEIVPISSSNIGGEEINTVDARTLHEALGSRRQFADWVRAKVVDNPFFMEGQDYILIHDIVKQDGHGGHNRKDYALTVDAAKKVAMSEQTPTGDGIRDYFLACERRAKDPMLALNDPSILRKTLLGYTERVLTLEAEKAVLTPKADALDRLSTADGLTCVTDAAKLIQVRPIDLFNYLREHKWIYRRVGGKGNVAYQNRIQQGLLRHKVHPVEQPDGSVKMYEDLKVTAKGITVLAKAFGKPDPAQRQQTLLQHN